MRRIGVIGCIACFSIFLSSFIGHAIELKRMNTPMTQQIQQMQEPQTVPDILSISLPNSKPAPSASLTQGQVYALILTTKNVDKTMVLSFGEGIELSNIQYLSDTSIKAEVKVTPNAPIGRHDINITYGGQSRTATVYVSVVAPSKLVVSKMPAPIVSQKTLQQTPPAAPADQPSAPQTGIATKIVKHSDMVKLNPQPEPPLQRAPPAATAPAPSVLADTRPTVAASTSTTPTSPTTPTTSTKLSKEIVKIEKTTNAPSLGTMVKPPLMITFPNGGETLEAGLEYPLKWEGSSVGRGNVEICIKGSNIPCATVPNTGSFGEKIPQDANPGSYKMSIKVPSTNIQDESEGTFKIVNPYKIKVISKGRVFKAESLTRQLADQLQDNDLIEYKGKQYAVGTLRSNKPIADAIEAMMKPEETKNDSYKLGNKTFDKRDEATEEMVRRSKGFADEQAFKKSLEDQISRFGGGPSPEATASQFRGVGGHDIPGQNNGLISIDGTGTGPNTGGLTGNLPGPNDAMGGGGGYMYSPADGYNFGIGFSIDWMGRNPTGSATAGGSSGRTGGSVDGSWNIGGNSGSFGGNLSYDTGTFLGNVGVGANSSGNVSVTGKGQTVNTDQVQSVFTPGGDQPKPKDGDQQKTQKTEKTSEWVSDYAVQQMKAFNDSVKSTGSEPKPSDKPTDTKKEKGDYNTKENNDGTEKPPPDDGTATAQPADDGTNANDTGGSARDMARVKAAARQFTGGTSGMGDSGWGDKPGANDEQRPTIKLKKANNAAATVLGIGQNDTEHDPNNVPPAPHGPGPSVSTDEEKLGPTTLPKAGYSIEK